MFYDLNAYNSIMSDVRISGRNTFSNDSTTYLINEDSTYNSYLETSGKTTYIEWSTDYIKTFDEDEKELNISFQVGGSLGDDNITNNENGEQQYSTDNDEKEIESTVQIDYTHPFSENNKLELGTKFINRDREIVNSTVANDTVFRADQELSLIHI